MTICTTKTYQILQEAFHYSILIDESGFETIVTAIDG